MICKRCSSDIADGQYFCPVCGEKMVNTANGVGNMNYSAYNQNGAVDARYGAGYGNNPPLYSQGVPADLFASMQNKVPTVKEYLKWILLYPLSVLIPGIGIIVYLVICLKYAFDLTYVARSNFFKATLIAHAVAFVLVLIAVILIFGIFGAAVFTGVDMLEEIYPEITNEFEYGNLRMFFGF